jgi:hypothetical protein
LIKSRGLSRDAEEIRVEQRSEGKVVAKGESLSLYTCIRTTKMGSQDMSVVEKCGAYLWESTDVISSLARHGRFVLIISTRTVEG